MNGDESSESDDEFNQQGLDIRHGHQMTNVFDNGGSGTTIIDRYTGALDDAKFLMKFSSPVISDFFDDVTECLIKRKVRQFLKLLAAFWCVILIKSLRYPECLMTTLLFSIAIISCLFFIYVCTFRQLSRTEYLMISLGSTMFSLTYTIFESARSKSAVDGAFAYPFSLIIMLIVFLPISVRVIIPLVSVFSVIFTLASMRKMTFTQLKRDIYRASLQPMTSQVDAYNYEIIDGGMTVWGSHAENYTMVQLTSWITVTLIGCYLRFWNELRRRSAFSIIGKSVKARKHSKKALQNQSEWITAIMPSQVRDVYMKIRRESVKNNNIWVFSTAFDEVSILFADIVGFTKMSSSKTATKIVMLLNDLYNRFDDLANLVHCEKIGTLGDCYYAVSGCPVYRPDHASCCVELGLGMCRIIKVFNLDNGEEVNMRVGIHTGRVNAAIIGNMRFRYDVYSSDVIIANQMETYGLPGRVHISRPTYKLVKNMYRFAKGESLPITREHKVGMGGTELKEVQLRTYFVDPLSSKIRKKNENFGSDIITARILTLDHDDSTADNYMEYSESEESENYMFDVPEGSDLKSARSKWTLGKDRQTGLFVGQSQGLLDEAEIWCKSNSRDIRLISEMQDDPQEQINLFRSMPLKPLLQTFKDYKVETDFKYYMEGFAPIVTVESPKLSPLFDVLAIAGINLLLTIPNIMHHTSESIEDLTRELNTSCMLLGITGLLGGLLIWGSTLHSAAEENNWRTKCYLFFAKSIVREVLLAILTTTPAFIFYLRTNAESIKTGREAAKRVIHFEFGMLSILIHSMATSSFAWVRGLCIFSTGVVLWLELMSLKGQFDLTYCEAMLWYHRLDVPAEGFEERIASVVTLMAVTYFITKENERSLRLWYFVSREAEISCAQATEENMSAQKLLDNVIPSYIFEQLALSGYKHLKAGTFCFATSIPGAGVTFACLTNFFHDYYREDYKGGESSLKLLNTIITSFDELMQQPEFETVEKIKTINDCYMIAAGLNKLQRATDSTDKRHIFELMEYCFGLYRTLDDVNDRYIIGSDRFLMKIGFYVGDVTAGIIGSTKPIYDIWGNTVNVASRMYSTGEKGKIQVPEDVKNILQDIYDFEYRGSVFVKGKGDMQTYFVHQKST